MAYVFGLAAECGPSRDSAVRVCAHFDRVPLAIRFDGKEESVKLLSKVSQNQDDGNWWAEIYAIAGVSRGGVGDTEDVLQLSCVGFALYEILHTAPAFRFAQVGVEVFQYNTLDGIARLLKQHPDWCDGLVLSNDAYDACERPDRMRRFSPSAWWIPYRGESHELED